MSKRKHGAGSLDSADGRATNVIRQRLDGSSSSTKLSPVALRELLDFSTVSEEAELNARFKLLASTLLREYRLVVQSRVEKFEYDILELEIYLYKSGCHEDPFTHRSEEQKESGKW